MAKDPQQWAKEQAATGGYWFNKCMSFVANALTGSNSGYTDANAGYAAMEDQTDVVKDAVPPANTPVFWTGGKHGHVALSAGGGYAWTNDMGGKGRITKEYIPDIDKWLGSNYTYQGFSPGYANSGDKVSQRAGRLPGGNARKLSDTEIYVTARAAGFSPDQAKTMTAIAIAESSGNAKATNDTRGRHDLPSGQSQEYSLGLWQINVKANGDLLQGQKPEALYDPLTNAKIAKQIYDRQGYNAWSVYKNRSIYKRS